MSLRTIKLRQIADARSGDKGNSANIGIIAHTPEGYEFLKGALTAEKVQAYFHPLGVQGIDRYELPNLQAFNFVLKGALDGGGSESLRLDPQGKSMGQVLLEMTLEAPNGLSAAKEGELASMDYPEEGIGVITLRRPAKRNALNVGMLESLCSHLDAAAQSPSLRALIITAEGPSFCAGMDLYEAVDPCKVECSAALIAHMLTMIVKAPFVTIAAAQGVAAGGGAGILSACDLAIAANDLQISYPEVRRGLVPAQVTPLLMRLVPRHIVHEFFFLGEPFDAERALSVGLVNKVVHPEYLFSEALQYGEAVCKGAPLAIQQTKALLRSLDRKTFTDDLDIALPYHHQSRHSAEAKEGAAAFFEKRHPSWADNRI